MADLRELYQEVILDHDKNPRNFKKLEPCSHNAEGFNPLCGDHYNVYLNLEEGVIREIGFEGSGCAISKAAASLMTTSVKGKSPEEAVTLFEAYRKMITGEAAPEDPSKMGSLQVFAEVGKYPARVKCALLAWHALIAALEGKQNSISTE